MRNVCGYEKRILVCHIPLNKRSLCACEFAHNFGGLEKIEEYIGKRVFNIYASNKEFRRYLKISEKQ